MEFQWDFLESLDPDVSSKILMSLDDPADIVRASSVSRAWRDFVISNGICKHLCLRLFPKLSGIARIIDTSNKEDAGCSRFVEFEHLKKEHKAYVALARGLTSSEVGECLSNAISASSTDNYPEEGLHNTLESRDRIGRRPSYWSSSGQSNPEVPERLTYKLISDFCIITEINVQPFQAFFQSDSPIYSAKAVRFHMGHRILPNDDGDHCDEIHEGRECAEKKFVWTYTSQDFPMTQENRLQNFKLPEPVLCFGGYLQIELLGRGQRQEMDGLFYICVAHVQVLGRSLDPVFGVKSLDPSGRFTLVHNPQAKFSAPRSSNEESDEISVTPEMVQRHVRGWEQILNMLRGTLGVEVYDSEDEILYSEDEMAEELEL
ncbi:F-box protein At4g00755-like [Chenopodium quinoa]|uniref:F-box protein At4g00755-like n=1 Tax=Chenopodium quinoa TaxID=63459 RepID=UPI000B7809E1|nr:F-box protein At4g00755-like [Chenopodium quinoa]XP_021748467.1 F-box protein At4g00755-like [Chenopodium quinoa]